MRALRSSDVSATDERGSGTPPDTRWASFVVLRWLVLLFTGVFLLALLVRRLAPYYPAWGATGATILDPPTREAWEAIAIGAGVLLAVAFPRFGRRAFGLAERAFSRFAVHRTHAIIAAAAFPVVVRLALLPLIPIPQPWVPDEFGHLLLADTFASGRITNPTHPLWPHFETLYVLHQPTYTSQYPIAQGLMLAVPIALRAHPWFGVCLSIALMCAALCWMLQGWLPPKWALLGALLAGARWSIVAYWMNSYWGGAAGAIGGALLLGALPRLLGGRTRDSRTRDSRTGAALMLGAGLFILAQSRPFEGLLLSLPVGALLLAGLVRQPRENLRVLATLTGVSILAAAGVLYYDWRVTGKALELPYQLHKQIYGTPPNLLWSAPQMDAPRVNAQRDIADNFEWQLGMFQEQASWPGFAKAMPTKLKRFWDFYFQPILTLPLLLLPLAMRRSRIRFLFLVSLFVLLAGLLLYPFFFAHYAAPLTGALLILMLQGARCLRTLRWAQQQRFGAAVFRWSLATAGVASCSLLVLGGMLCPACVSTGATGRSRVADELRQRGGKHLVLVRYSPTHDFNYPWIYNAASIDESPVIWARELDPASAVKLIRRYPDREAWLVNADDPTPELLLYADKDRPQISSILNAAGKGPFFKTGVSPGSIVTLFGRRFGRRFSNSMAASQAGACRTPQTTTKAREIRPILLPGFDASRPGVVIPAVEEAVPSLTIAKISADEGGIFSLTGKDPAGGGHLPDANALAVRFGELPATILCAEHSGDRDAVTVLVPTEITGDTVYVVVRAGDNESKPQAFTVLPANPGILQMWWSGKRAALVLHANGDLVVPANPARRGEILRMFLTGTGAPGVNGPQFPFIVGVNNRGAPLRGVNCAGCRGGIAELRFEVPQESPTGDDIPLSAAVVVSGKPVFSNTSAFAVR